MSKIEFETLKEQLNISKIFDKDSDYIVVETIYDYIKHNPITFELVTILFYGLDDKTEDLETTNSFIDIIFSISQSNVVSEKLAKSLLSGFQICWPKAKNLYQGMIASVLLQKDISFFLSELKNYKENENIKQLFDELDKNTLYNSNWVFRENISKIFSQLSSN